MSEEEQLRQITAAMLMGAYLGTFEAISENVDSIANQIMKAIDEIEIPYESKEIHHAVIDSIAMALKMKRGIKEW